MLDIEFITRSPRATLLVTLLACAACDCGDNMEPPPTDMDAGVRDIGPQSSRDGGTNVVEVCNNPPLQAPSSGTCAVKVGDNFTLIRSDIVVPEGRLENGQLLIKPDGKIACAACDCSSEAGYSGATVVECANGVVSPGLINGHEHLNFSESPPRPHQARYDHRHDWRKGKNGHTALGSPSNGSMSAVPGKLWGELRHLMGGATTINGSGGAPGLLRNLDVNSLQHGLDLNSVEYSTFPLGDASGDTRSNDCGYRRIPSPTASGINNSVAYTPHIAEGINLDARNEFLCLSSTANGGEDVILSKTSIIHAIGVTPADVANISADRASVIWSPRTNIDLYGHTAQVTMMARYGVNLALGTDWVVSGSMNMLRELQCADSLNKNNYGTYFDDREIVDMATKNGAHALGAGDKIGQLAAGFEADVVIFNRHTRKPYRAIIEAEVSDVVMVMRGGKALYGDQEVISGLRGDVTNCETLDVCSQNKMLCMKEDAGATIAELRTQIMDIYTDRNLLPRELYEPFYCGMIPKEPSCIPYRAGEFMGMSDGSDLDGDGISNDLDLCPNIFSAIRPLDNAKQADADQDMVGDVCDPCPLDAFSTDCKGPNPDDPDGDGILSNVDNCPEIANADQSDRDEDMKGDVCDPCPDQANPGTEACVVTVYEIKQGQQTGIVKITGMVVTATSVNGYFVQMPSDHASYDANLKEKFSGVFVFTNGENNPSPGDKLDLQGETVLFYGQTQIQNSSFSLTTPGVALPAPVIESPANLGTGGSLASEYEGVLVEVQNVAVTEVQPVPGTGDMAPTNAYVVDGALRVNDLMYLTDPFPMVNDEIAFVRGILRHAHMHSKLEPRGMDDVGLAPRLRAFEPDVLYVPTATVGIPAGGFLIRLTRAAETQMSISLVSSSTTVTVPNMVMIDAGQDHAEIPVTVGLPNKSEEVVVTASYDGKTVFAKVYPYQDSFDRHAVAIRLSNTSLRPNASTTGEIELNLPSASFGTEISLRVHPSDLGQVFTTTTSSTATTTVSVMITPEQRLGGFNFVATSSTGTGVISAYDSVGTVTASVSFEVTTSVTRTPVPGDLIITEVFRNPGGDQPEKVREWFELHNMTTDSIVLDGISIIDNRGPTRGHLIEMTGALIPPGGYAIIAYSSDPSENGDLVSTVAYGAADIQLSNSGDQVTLLYNGMTLDEVIWTGSWPGGDNGRSMCLKAPYGDNSMSSSWSDSVGTFGSNQETGHPGIASDSTNCP